jgi:hypothetical protein
LSNINELSIIWCSWCFRCFRTSKLSQIFLNFLIYIRKFKSRSTRLLSSNSWDHCLFNYLESILNNRKWISEFIMIYKVRCIANIFIDSTRWCLGNDRRRRWLIFITRLIFCNAWRSLELNWRDISVGIFEFSDKSKDLWRGFALLNAIRYSIITICWIFRGCKWISNNSSTRCDHTWFIIRVVSFLFTESIRRIIVLTLICIANYISLWYINCLWKRCCCCFRLIMIWYF